MSTESLLREPAAQQTHRTLLSIGNRHSIDREGIHRAEFRITNMGGATRELVEEAVLARENHARNGEALTLTEAADHDVIHVRFHTLVSVQELIKELRNRKIEVAEFSISWNDDVTATMQQSE